jgi:hypothetical protein
MIFGVTVLNPKSIIHVEALRRGAFLSMHTEQEKDFRGKKGERLAQGLHGLL